jgi:general secretion pathway protein G
MAERAGSNLRDCNSQGTRSSGKIKTSAAALGSFVCGIAGTILSLRVLPHAIDPVVHHHDAVIQIILGCSIVSIILGFAGFVRIGYSSGRLKGSGFAITGLVLSIIWRGGAIAGITPWVSKIVYPKAAVAIIQIMEFESALEVYARDNGSLPTDEQGLDALVHNLKNSNSWKGPYLGKEAPNDPWGRPYQYRNPGINNPDFYDLWSDGYDGIAGTADDITGKTPNPGCSFD